MRVMMAINNYIYILIIYSHAVELCYNRPNYLLTYSEMVYFNNYISLFSWIYLSPYYYYLKFNVVIKPLSLTFSSLLM